MTRLRMASGMVTVVGAALLASSDPAHSTMPPDLGPRFCCGYDSNGDGRADSWCCYDTGCSSGPRGCIRVG
jgi:hypothetical protein